MPNTMTLIASSTVGSGGAASIDFSSIPSTYTDLQILLSARTTRSGNNDFIQIRFNGSTTNYSARFLYGSSTAQSFTDTKIYGYTSSAPSTANTFGSLSYYVPNYLSSNNKSVSIDSVSENNASTADSYALCLVAGLWSNTSAITSITLQPLSGTDNFVQYSTAYLYGIIKS
jgi:hypothetical protein